MLSTKLFSCFLPGFLLRPYHAIYSLSLLEGMKCWKCLVLALNQIPVSRVLNIYETNVRWLKGWVKKSEHSKVLKLILKGLSTTITNKNIRIRNQSNSHDCTASSIREELAVINCIVDTLHLLIEASWYAQVNILGS